MTNPKWWRCVIPRDETLKDGRPNPYYGFTTTELGENFEHHGAERWVLGEEIGEGGYKHWQGHVVFAKGITVEKLREIFPFSWWSPSTTHNFDYEEKTGKFVRSWEKGLTRFVCAELYEWQKDLIKRIDENRTDDRRIIFLMDGEGASGKTFLCKHLVAQHKAAYCPPLPEALDYMAWALAHHNAGCFIIDLPRAEAFQKVEKEQALWSAIEQMKNGYLYDKRHEWREMWIEPPAIVVLGNFEPRWGCLSSDRWVTGTMKGKERKHKWIEWQ